uniref:GNAT family N-acetyltransferase n=1 Tax=Phenylobacterium glaciei TaxID=2803784 RepID=A0A974P7L5_9CAUL|nr:GNAT family N-acetyltransferase [Phenylobacterium glaciei]
MTRATSRLCRDHAHRRLASPRPQCGGGLAASPPRLGSGIATEAARASLADGFERCGFKEVLSYTEATNHRSQAVMRKLGLERDEARDFTSTHGGHTWSGLVWVAKRP